MRFALIFDAAIDKNHAATSEIPILTFDIRDTKQDKTGLSIHASLN